MSIPVSALGGIGAIPVIGPVIIGVIGVAQLIATLLGIAFGQSAVEELAAAVAKLQYAVTAAVQQLTAFIWTVAYALGKILQWLHDALVGFFTLLWQLLKQFAAWLKNILADILPKILNVIQRLRQFLQMVYLKYIRPVLVWLQYARQFLALLRIFHVGWATKLDNFLVQLQGKIIQPFLWVLQTVNGIGTWINFIVTATGLIQRPLFINSMYAYQSDWVPMWWSGQTPIGGAPPVNAPQPQNVPAAPAQVQAQLYQYSTTDTGPIAQAAAASQQVLSQYGYGKFGVV